jgi:CHAT domain-containing protein/tetratricopeptide (TPR) repeat protein
MSERKLSRPNGAFKAAAFAVLMWLPSSASMMAEQTGFVEPPRTIDDITAILDQQKPDDIRIAELRARADAEPRGDADTGALVRFFYFRAEAREATGRVAEAIADLKNGIELGREHNLNVSLLPRYLGLLYSWSGNNKSALQAYLAAVEENQRFEPSEFQSFGTYRLISQVYVFLGDLAQAEVYVRRLDALWERYTASTTDKVFSDQFFAQVQFGHARLHEARGRYREAEQAYGLALAHTQRGLQPGRKVPVSRDGQLTTADNLIASGGRVKARQGRVAEGEIDARRALLNRLATVGKYSLSTARTIPYLATILTERGRYPESEKLTRATIDIYLALGVSKDSLAYAFNLSELGTILGLQERWIEAAEVYLTLEHQVAEWEPDRKDDLLLTPARVYALYQSGELQSGLSMADAMVARAKSRFGEDHFDYAVARGYLAIGLASAGRGGESVQEFRSAIPLLLARLSESATEEGSNAAARQQYARTIIESYLGELARGARDDGATLVAETLRLADYVRGQSVQKALNESSARASVSDTELAALARKEQDLSKQLGAELELINSILASPPQERDKKGVGQVTEMIGTLRAERDAARAEINKRFPTYADLVDPKPPSVDQIRAALGNGEAMLSFYFGRQESFVWVVPKQGPAVFSAIHAPAAEIDGKIRKLRNALDEPQQSLISDIPSFDLKLGYELYSLLLKPVEAAWKPANSLIVVTNGALGSLPLSLLPTAPAEISKDDEPLFSSYRTVPWLARTHAVTVVPSSAALRTLRQLPPGKPGRAELIAFGDPIFSAKQADGATKAVAPAKPTSDGAATSPGVSIALRAGPKPDGVDSNELAMLPPLPDTADELRSIAEALRADPTNSLHLGKDANEYVVKTTDLSRYKVLAFATHGLVPGELDGLTQPALALTAPDIAGIEGDGLLTMDEVLALKLDADWVVLSACNTGAGEGAGAEWFSGLGRAFFYAGTRAVLLTNWSVNSQSAKELVAGLFKRQADDPGLTRAEALRQAMLAVMDGPGYVGADGKTEFTYAHPLFWAPYSIIGDGGRR